MKRTVNLIPVRALQSFNRYHCAKLVLDSLVFFDDPAMNRMSVAICSILAAKISTCETSSLGAEPMYMKRLLRIVKTKVCTKLNQEPSAVEIFLGDFDSNFFVNMSQIDSRLTSDQRRECRHHDEVHALCSVEFDR